MTIPYPPTIEDWRMLKRATRHRKHLERLAEADEASADTWLAAVERDDRTDPYEPVKRQVVAPYGTES